jgi:DNA-binding MarR family transcriptional regulator
MARYSILSTRPREALEFTNALERAARALRTARRGLSGAYGLTVAEWWMLRALRPPRESTAASAGAGMCQERSLAELARRLRISRQAAHRTAARLERAGLLRCVQRGGDRRLRLASLTPDGEHSLERLESTMHKLLLEMTNDISPHWLEPLTNALTRLSDRLRSCPTVCRASLQGRRAGGRPRKPVNHVDEFSAGGVRPAAASRPAPGTVA